MNIVGREKQVNRVEIVRMAVWFIDNAATMCPIVYLIEYLFALVEVRGKDVYQTLKKMQSHRCRSIHGNHNNSNSSDNKITVEIMAGKFPTTAQ